jgi:hypothetical protein
MVVIDTTERPSEGSDQGPEQVLRNLRMALAAARAGPEHVVKAIAVVPA